jgi:hypothetical protein
VIKCNFCGSEFEKGRAAHMHMMRMHYNDYKKYDCDLEKVSEGYIRKKVKSYPNAAGARKEEPKVVESDRPKRLRLLNKLNPEELEAYQAGYRYFDPESELAFTTEECQEEGWI